ncbi:MAG: type II toxin-antitoxin system YafQ family toxin [Patescibacteria group bacterium]|nr:type II toxin-antitoxin system YafQ family toxin [Patescibacteria group bacterium]
MFELKYSKSFKKDIKIYRYNKITLFELEKILDILISGKELPYKNLNHKLIGDFFDCFECHIRPDVLLIYKIDYLTKNIFLLRIGTHSKLF